MWLKTGQDNETAVAAIFLGMIVTSVRGEWRVFSLMKDLYSLVLFAPMHNLRLVVCRLLKSCLAQYLSFDDVYSHPLGPAGKRRKLILLKLSLFKAYNEIMAHVQQKHALPVLHVNFAEKQKTAQLNSLLTGDGF